MAASLDQRRRWTRTLFRFLLLLRLLIIWASWETGGTHAKKVYSEAHHSIVNGSGLLVRSMWLVFHGISHGDFMLSVKLLPPDPQATLPPCNRCPAWFWVTTSTTSRVSVCPCFCSQRLQAVSRSTLRSRCAGSSDSLGVLCRRRWHPCWLPWFGTGRRLL